MKNVISNDSNSIQEAILLHKKIPKHRRPKFIIESTEDLYKKIALKKDQSQRLGFHPFGYYRKTTNGEEIGYFRRTIKTSAKIAKSFNLYLQGGQGANDKVFAQFSQEVKKMQGLKTFIFDMWRTADIDDFALRNLVIGLKPLKNLQYLRIRIDESNLYDQGFAYVAKAVRGIVSLETLDLTFDEGPATDKGIKALWSSFKYLKNLKTLNMSFHYCGGIEYAEIGNVEKNFKGLKSLKEIKLNFFLAEMMDFEGINNLSSMFKVLTNLEKIDLCLARTEMDNKGLKKLIEGFRGKSKLKKITLNIGRTSVTNKGLDSLKECVKGLSEIEEITIDLEGCEKVNKKGIEKLKKDLEEIPSLKHLEIKI